jgi:hypothetical protein
VRGDLQQLHLPEHARARLEVERKPRAIATRKLRDVLARAVATPAIRTIWVHGSYARGASTVGDVDLMIEVDDAREKGQAAWDNHQAYIRGRNPASDILRALGASGSSMIEAVISRNHDQTMGEPLPLDDWKKVSPAERERFAPASPPQLQLLGSGEVVETAMRAWCIAEATTSQQLTIGFWPSRRTGARHAFLARPGYRFLMSSHVAAEESIKRSLSGISDPERSMSRYMLSSRRRRTSCLLRLKLPFPGDSASDGASSIVEALRNAINLFERCSTP